MTVLQAPRLATRELSGRALPGSWEKGQGWHEEQEAQQQGRQACTPDLRADSRQGKDQGSDGQPLESQGVVGEGSAAQGNDQGQDHRLQVPAPGMQPCHGRPGSMTSTIMPRRSCPLAHARGFSERQARPDQAARPTPTRRM